jgi:hypothetical protein
MLEEEHEVRKSFFRLFAAFLFWGVGGFFGFCCFLSFGGLGDEYGGWLMMLVFRREGSRVFGRI